MTFGYVLLEEGVEADLEAGLTDMLELFDSEVPKFRYQGSSYLISSMKGVLGSKLKLLVKTSDGKKGSAPSPAVGYIEVDKLQGNKVHFRIPPRVEWGNADARAFDPEGKFFGSFVFHLLNALQARGLLHLPGQLPVS